MATAEQIQQELNVWNEENHGYGHAPEAVSDELWTWNDEPKSFEIPSGTVTLVENVGGGEGEGEERYIVFSLGNQFFRYDGSYSSWVGTDWDDELREVEPVKVEVIQYHVKKED